MKTTSMPSQSRLRIFVTWGCASLLLAVPRGAPAETYVWVDEAGMTHLTDDPEAVPVAMRAHADDRSIGLHVHTHVREDALVLFGFWTEREKLLFEKLISVSGIGPEPGARHTLRHVGRGATGSDRRLATRAAPRQHSRDRQARLRSASSWNCATRSRDWRPDLPDRHVAVSVDDDLVAALVNLGYKRTQAERAVISGSMPGEPRRRLPRPAPGQPQPTLARLAPRSSVGETG